MAFGHKVAGRLSCGSHIGFFIKHSFRRQGSGWKIGDRAEGDGLGDWREKWQQSSDDTEISAELALTFKLFFHRGAPPPDPPIIVGLRPPPYMDFPWGRPKDD